MNWDGEDHADYLLGYISHHKVSASQTNTSILLDIPEQSLNEIL